MRVPAPVGTPEDCGIATGDRLDFGDIPGARRCVVMVLGFTSDSFRWTWVPSYSSGAPLCSTPEIGVRAMERAFHKPNKRNKEE